MQTLTTTSVNVMPRVTPPAPTTYPQTPAPVMAPNQMVPASGTHSGGGVVALLENFWNGIVNFFRGLFTRSNQTQPNTNAPVTPTVPSPQLAPNSGNVDDAALAQQYGLLNTPENVRNFRETVSRQSLEMGAVGPGSTNRDAVNELQDLLKRWGFNITNTGEFDLATANAVMQWKVSVGVVESFVFANGSPGVTPIIDTRTRAKMIEVLTSAQQANMPQPASAIMPGVASPVTIPNQPQLVQPFAPLPVSTPFAPVPPVTPVINPVAPIVVADPLLTPPMQPIAPTANPVAPVMVADPAVTVPMQPITPTTNPVAPILVADPAVTVPMQPITPTISPVAPVVVPDPALATGAQPSPVTVVTNGQDAAAMDAVTRFGLQATAENLQAFQAAWGRLSSDPGAIGPGQNDTPDAVAELQQVMTLLGYPVAVTGVLDPATQHALSTFKIAHNLTDGYNLANGSAGALPWVDQRTKDIMVQRLTQNTGS